MARRTGIPSLIEAAAELCRLLAKYTPLIKTLYPSNPGLHTALDDANAACSALAAVLEAIREYGD